MRWLSDAAERVRTLLFRRREDRELREEFEFHAEMQTRENQRLGMDPVEARRQAMIAFGGMDRMEEQVREARGTRSLEDLGRDLRLAARRLVREPGYTVPTVATVALGVGVMTASFALVDAVLLRPLPYPAAERLVEVGHAASGAELIVAGQSAGTLVHYRDRSRAFEALGTWTADVTTLTDGDAAERVGFALVSPSLFEVLGAVPAMGRFPVLADAAGSGRGGAVLSHDLWVRRYGSDPDIVGRTVEIDRRPETVVGVARPGFHFPQPDTDLWLGLPPEEMFNRFGGPRASLSGLFLTGVGRLRPGVGLEEATADVDRMIRTLPDAYSDVTLDRIEAMGLHAVLTPLQETVVGDVRPGLLLLMAAAGFLLLIGWANATNLSLARSERLRREVTVERWLGAGRGRVARRFVLESLLVCGVGTAAGLGMAWAAVAARFGFAPGRIPRLGEAALDVRAMALAVGLGLLTAALLTAVSLRSALAGGGARGTGASVRTTAGARDQAVRRVLVAAQVALACTLLIGSALMARSYARLSGVELGFRPGGALTFLLTVPSDPYAGYGAAAAVHADVRARLAGLPGVDAVEAATTSAFPLTAVPGYYSSRISTPDAASPDSASRPDALVALATAGYFEAMGIPLLEGRPLDPSDAPRGSAGVVVSASLARVLFGDGAAVGRPVRLAGTGGLVYTVVGVAGDVPARSVADGPSRALYLPNVPTGTAPDSEDVPPFAPREERYVVRTALPATAMADAVRASVAAVDAKLLVAEFGTLDALVSDSTARARLTLLLLLVGSASALLLGMIGIYGVLSYTVRQRTPELGVRIALGASPEGMTRMVVRQSALLAASGIAAGVLAAALLTRFMRSLLFEVAPGDPVAFVGVAALVFAVALAASWLPARRAGRTDPLRALRAE